jgi:hypothetical protein
MIPADQKKYTTLDDKSRIWLFFNRHKLERELCAMYDDIKAGNNPERFIAYMQGIGIGQSGIDKEIADARLWIQKYIEDDTMNNVIKQLVEQIQDSTQTDEQLDLTIMILQDAVRRLQSLKT